MDRARKLLIEARDAIFQELHVIGLEEIKTNSTLRARNRLLNRINKFLETPEKKHVKSKSRA